MPMLLHPWLYEARLAVVRGGDWRGWRLRALALASCIAVPVGLRLWSEETAALPAALPRLIAQLPLPFGLLAIAFAYALARGRLIALDDTLRHGWWAAAPIEPARATRTLILLALVAGLAAMAIVALVLAAFGGGGEVWRGACAIVETGVAVGTGLGLISALRHRRHPARRTREGARQPLFGLRWLDDARLPHLSDWQRREALLRWRRGGHAWMIGAVLLALPSSTAAASGAGVLLIAIALAWFSLVVQSCAAATVDAESLLTSAPREPHALARAAWRYPAFAFACTTAFAAAGSALLSLSWRAAPVLLAILTVLCLPALSALRFLHRSAPR
ncbi:hypothetical protein [Lysobacter sp. CA199]|uniref:hypothetical protein n=1 Tax=Lysobacter sp. CA199 TaxID=3455608 RepID=UPI003F8D6115